MHKIKNRKKKSLSFGEGFRVRPKRERGDGLDIVFP
jgi:hypothetical protein